MIFTNSHVCQNLQSYIQKVNWSSPQQVSEAYNLLSNLKEPLPLVVSSITDREFLFIKFSSYTQVAFNFLDSGCANEFVRAFAVERLRELQDEELIDYLLQLVQVELYSSILGSVDKNLFYRH